MDKTQRRGIDVLMTGDRGRAHFAEGEVWTVYASGVLELQSKDGEVIANYAPGTWLMVCRGAEVVNDG